MLQETFNNILDSLTKACRSHYGDRLVTLALFGSVARGTMGHEPDIDLLIIAEDLPRGRMPRMHDFEQVEEQVDEAIAAARGQGVFTSLSPIIKTPGETEQGSPLFLDMTDQALILFDRDQFFAKYLERLRQRLKEMGARRVFRGGGYYWILKPDLKQGEIIRL